MTLNNPAIAPSNSPSSFLAALLEVQYILQSFAQADGFQADRLASAFGTALDSQQLQSLGAAFAQGDFSGLPGIAARPGSDLDGAMGIYVAETNQVYLSESLLQSGNQAQIVAVLLEEIGHSIDAQVNVQDSAGDEGAIFAALIQGQSLSEAQLAALQAENDQIILHLEGQWVVAEQAPLTENSPAGNVNNAPVFEPPAPTQTPLPGTGALQFNGTDDHVVIAIREPDTEITHELWFRTTTPGGGLFSVGAGNQGAGGSDRHLYLTPDGNLGARVWSNEIITTTGLNLADGEWHHIAHSIGASVGGQILYVDGVEVARGTKTASDFTWDNAIQIGFSNDAGEFDGDIAEVRIWNVARSQADIAANLSQSLTGNESGLLGYWDFESGSGTVAVDRTSNGNDGTLVNFAPSPWLDTTGDTASLPVQEVLVELGDGEPGENTTSLTANGTFAFTDVELNDTHTVQIINDGLDYLGTIHATLADPATGDGNGSVAWDFSVADAALDALAQGESRVQTYSLSVEDNSGAIATEQFTITLLGSNDRPILTVETNDRASATVTETDASLSTSGTLTLADADITDVVSMSISNVAVSGAGATDWNIGTLRGFLTVTASDTNATAGGTVNWAFDSGTEAFDYLAAGESLIVTYSLTANDNKGGTQTQDVVITINGTNDAPIAVADPSLGGNNDTLATAQSLDGLDWSLAANPNIEDETLTNTSTTIPHLTLDVTGDDTYDYYSFTVSNAGDLAIFDIDFGETNASPSTDVDTYLRLFDLSGTEIDDNDDSGLNPLDSGSVDSYDSFLTHTFANPGTYILKVSRFSDNPITLGTTYQLHVSLENPITPFRTTEEQVLTPPSALLNDVERDRSDVLTIIEVEGQAIALNTPVPIASGATVTLNADNTFDYDPNGQFDALVPGETGTDSFSYSISDGNGGTDTTTVTVELEGRNDAPELTGNALLAAIEEDSTDPMGETISALLTPLLSDPDQNAVLSGVAIVANPADAALEGSWQYSTDGATWYDIGTINDDANALVLSAATTVRFVPVANYNGSPAPLSVRAIDNTYSLGVSNGATRVTVDSSVNGGTAAIAAATATVGITITPTPIINIANATVAEGTGGTLID